MRPRILVAEPKDFSPDAVKILEEAGQVELRACGRDELASAFGQYDVIWFRLAHRIDREMLSDSPRCRILATAVTGLDHIDLEACQERNIRVVSLRGEVDFLTQVRATAELTIGLTLALLRRIVPASQSVKAGRWDRDLFRGREIFGKTIGLVGMGRLGTLVAGYFSALGGQVLGYDPREDFPEGSAQRVGSLEELFASSDIISLHPSYSHATRHLVGQNELAAARPGAVLINTSRGGIVDESALLNALRSGRLSGGALDVLEGEPGIAADHPLVAYAREHENLLIVPHIGGNTSESFDKTERFLARRVVEALADRNEAPQ